MLEDNQTIENTAVSNAALPKVSFIKKHKIALAITTAIILVLVALFIFLPVISFGNLKIVNLNASVRLEKEQTVKLKGSNISIRMTNLANESCPKGKTCFGSGQIIEYELTIDGKKNITTNTLNLPNSDYQIETIKSDYETYAEIKIVNNK